MTTEEKIESVITELNSEFDRLENLYIEKFRELDPGDSYVTAMQRNSKVAQEFSSNEIPKLLELTQDLISRYQIEGIEEKLMDIFDIRSASILNTIMGLD